MSDEIRFALDDAKTTLARADRLIETFGRAESNAADGVLSLAPRQAKELRKFIEAYRAELRRYRDVLEASQSQIDSQLLMTRRMELEETVRFVDRAFVLPRTWGQERQVLEAADWMCVEGFRYFVTDSEDQPIGPVVAIDSALSPAVWAPSAKLPIPSLFQTQPRTIDRSEKLAQFPLICLPGHLARSPEFFPLLSHEVGHAADYARAFTTTILDSIKDVPLLRYWTAWMREIIADAVGLVLSGEAFLIALYRYLNQLTPLVEVSTSNAYPANALRLAFIGECISRMTGLPPNSPVDELIPDAKEIRGLNRTAAQLLSEFRERVLPVIADNILNCNPAWPQEQQTVRDIAEKLVAQKTVTWPDQPFRLMPSAIAVAHKASSADGKFDTFKHFRNLHRSVPSKRRPDWIGGETNWKFTEEYLPSLRPTLLGADGNFKVPPLLLMITHQKIAFVGATNWQLCDKLQEAFEARNEVPWKELHLFFASDELLKSVEYGDFDARLHREESRKLLTERLSTKGWAQKWAIYEFDGPAVFASYWDWDERGGRIHISPALLGTVIGECPASDHLWCQEAPTDQYKKYVKHLNVLLNDIPGTSATSQRLI